MSGLCIRAHSPSTTSRRLCGGMLVAMPTAMPEEPFTSRLGALAGSTVGSSCSDSVTATHEGRGGAIRTGTLTGSC